MGRKNKKKGGHGARSDTPPEAKELSKSAKKEIMDHVRSLLEKCSRPPNTGPKEFEDYLEIHEIIEKIRKLQSAVTLPPTQRDSNFSQFLEWLRSNGVDTEAVDVKDFQDCGYGLQAAREIKGEELFLSIPRKLMMTTASAQASPLGALMAEDRILQAMPSVVLSLHLLCERRTEASLWKSYIDILPDTYATPLYFTPEDLKCLKGSPAQSDCLNQYRNIARQYAYFYKLFQNDASADKLTIKDCFTYDDYRWAVSTVMTRQNHIPTPDGSKMTFALIPLWDMCNHCNGLITTDFNLEKDCSECFALQNYQKGDQIYIFYGARSNAELLVNNGFVYPENEHDRMAVKLGISKDDPLVSAKSDLLTKCGLLTSRTFYLHTGIFPVDTDLLIFLRIFCMDEDNLKKFSEMELEEGGLREELGDLDKPVDKDLEVKVWSFVQTRATLLLRAYGTTVEEDEAVLKKKDVPAFQSLAVNLRCCEKKILQLAADYAAEKKQTLEEQT